MATWPSARSSSHWPRRRDPDRLPKSNRSALGGRSMPAAAWYRWWWRAPANPCVVRIGRSNQKHVNPPAPITSASKKGITSYFAIRRLPVLDGHDLKARRRPRVSHGASVRRDRPRISPSEPGRRGTLRKPDRRLPQACPRPPARRSITSRSINKGDLDASLAGRVEVDTVDLNGCEPRAFRLQPRRRRAASPATPISAKALGEGTALTTKVTDQSSLVGLVSWAQKV